MGLTEAKCGTIIAPEVVHHLSFEKMLLCRETIYIDEDKKFMRLKRQNTKKWFNSYLTFQHLKENFAENLVNQDDRNNMWLPIYDEVNAQDKSKIVLFAEEEIFKIIPQANNNFILNSKTDHNNARLFKVGNVSLTIKGCVHVFEESESFNYLNPCSKPSPGLNISTESA